MTATVPAALASELAAFHAFAPTAADGLALARWIYSRPAAFHVALCHECEDKAEDGTIYAAAFEVLCEGTAYPAELCADLSTAEDIEAEAAELSGSFGDVPADVLAREFPGLRREWDADRRCLRAFRGERCLATATRRRIYSTGPAFTISTADGAEFGTAENTNDARTVLRAAAQAFENRGCLPAWQVRKPVPAPVRMVPQVAQQQQGRDMRAVEPVPHPEAAPGDTAAHVARVVAAGWYQVRAPYGRTLDNTTTTLWRHPNSPDSYGSAHQVCLALGDDTAPVFPAMVPQQVQQAQSRDGRRDVEARPSSIPMPPNATFRDNSRAISGPLLPSLDVTTPSGCYGIHCPPAMPAAEANVLFRQLAAALELLAALRAIAGYPKQGEPCPDDPAYAQDWLDSGAEIPAAALEGIIDLARAAIADAAGPA